MDSVTNGAPNPQDSSSGDTTDMKMKKVRRGSSSSAAGDALRVEDSALRFELPRSLTGWMPYLFTLGVGVSLYSLHLRSRPKTAIDVVRRAAHDFRRLWRG